LVPVACFFPGRTKDLSAPLVHTYIRKKTIKFANSSR